MLVSEPHRKLLLNLQQPEKVTSIIPRSRMVSVKGRDIVAVEHDLDEVRVLRNIGISAPSPVRYYYDWSGSYTPFSHQVDTTEFLTLNPRAFCLNDMGTGKSVSVLWAYDYLRSVGRLQRMLVISPLSTLERTWGDEVFRHFAHLDFAVLHGTAAQRSQRLAKDCHVYIINHDGIKSANMLDELTRRLDIDLVVVDEIASFRNASTQRWKALNFLVNGSAKKNVPPKTWVWGLTGTPIPNAPTDAWAQVRLIRPDLQQYRFFGQFRDAVMRQITQFKWVSKTTALETVYDLMQPAVRFSRAECLDLPPTTYLDRHAALSKEQAALYKEMLNKFRAEFEGGHITALNEAVKVNKLLQIVAGAAYSDDGDVTIPCKERVECVREVIEESGSKVIVFVPFTAALQQVAADLGRSFTVEVVHGGVSKAARDRIFGEFQNGNDPKVLVANAGTMSHGLTLTAADTIVWYSPVHSAEIYEQANARIVRPGQTRNTRIVRVEGSDLERRMYDKLQRRTTTQGTLLDMFK